MQEARTPPRGRVNHRIPRPAPFIKNKIKETEKINEYEVKALEIISAWNALDSNEQRDFCQNCVRRSIREGRKLKPGKDDTIKVNPMLKVDRPAPRKGEKGQGESEKAYTVQQLRYILQCLENESLKWRCYVSLIADTGVRRGEACGLE